jgi:hypothetical protein
MQQTRLMSGRSQQRRRLRVVQIYGTGLRGQSERAAAASAIDSASISGLGWI